LGSVGGALGLYLGISIVSLIEFAELGVIFSLFCFKKFKFCNYQQKRVQQAQVVAMNPKSDFTPDK
jgi:hypothetical protein